jgi:DNA-binding MarR family transcriptional regulator
MELKAIHKSEARQSSSPKLSNSVLFEMNRASEFRSRRNTILPSELFADPAWDMLLCLGQNHKVGTRTSVKSLCIGSRCPSTTALRYLAALEANGLVERSADPVDRRRQFVSLTCKGLEALNKIFSDASQRH